MFEFITFSLFASFLSSDTLRWLCAATIIMCASGRVRVQPTYIFVQPLVSCISLHIARLFRWLTPLFFSLRNAYTILQWTFAAWHSSWLTRNISSSIQLFFHISNCVKKATLHPRSLEPTWDAILSLFLLLLLALVQSGNWDSHKSQQKGENQLKKS